MTFSYLNAVMQVGLEHFAENNLSEPKAQTSCWLLQPLQIRGKLEGFERNEPPNLSGVIPPVQNQSHGRVSFLLHYFLEKALKTPRYPGRRVCWGKGV